MKKKKSLLLFLAATSASFVQAAPPSPSENGCLGYIIEGRTAIATPPKPIEGHIFFHLKILFYVKQFVIRA